MQYERKYVRSGFSDRRRKRGRSNGTSFDSLSTTASSHEFSQNPSISDSADEIVSVAGPDAQSVDCAVSKNSQAQGDVGIDLRRKEVEIDNQNTPIKAKRNYTFKKRKPGKGLVKPVHVEAIENAVVCQGSNSGAPVTLLEDSSKSPCECDYYESRKVVVRTDSIDGEPCEFGQCKSVSFVAYFFVCWRSFDPDTEPKQYAECCRFPLSKEAVEFRRLGYGAHRTGSTRRHVETDFKMIPSKCVYFVNDMECHGLLDQAENFPELINHYAPPIMQPRTDVVSSYKDSLSDRTILTSGRSISATQVSQLSVLGSGLDVRMSRIPNAGRGIYATQNFCTSQIITLYFGHVFGEQEREMMQRNNRGSHCKPLQFKHSYLDGVKTAFTGMHAGQLLNQGDKTTCNCDWAVLEVLPMILGERVLAIKATRNILCGEELYISYGSKFWAEQMAAPTAVPPVILREKE